MAVIHFKTAKGWAESCGFQYVEVKSKTDFENNRNLLTDDTPCPVLMEVFVSFADSISERM